MWLYYVWPAGHSSAPYRTCCLCIQPALPALIFFAQRLTAAAVICRKNVTFWSVLNSGRRRIKKKKTSKKEQRRVTHIRFRSSAYAFACAHRTVCPSSDCSACFCCCCSPRDGGRAARVAHPYPRRHLQTGPIFRKAFEHGEACSHGARRLQSRSRSAIAPAAEGSPLLLHCRTAPFCVVRRCAVRPKSFDFMLCAAPQYVGGATYLPARFLLFPFTFVTFSMRKRWLQLHAHAVCQIHKPPHGTNTHSPDTHVHTQVRFFHPLPAYVHHCQPAGPVPPMCACWPSCYVACGQVIVDPHASRRQQTQCSGLRYDLSQHLFRNRVYSCICTMPVSTMFKLASTTDGKGLAAFCGRPSA